MGFLVGCLAIGFVGAAPAQGRTVDHYFGPFLVDFTDTSDCGFPVHWHITGEFHEVDQYDASGAPIQTIVTQGHGAVQVSATAKGVTLGGTAPQNYVDKITYNPDGSIATQSWIGIFLQITVPGEGTVLAQVGRLVFDAEYNVLFQAGPNQDFGGDHVEYCAAFG